MEDVHDSSYHSTAVPLAFDRSGGIWLGFMVDDCMHCRRFRTRLNELQSQCQMKDRGDKSVDKGNEPKYSEEL